MNPKDLFLFKNYRTYLSTRLRSEGARSGAQALLAARLQVHTTLVSQVLKGSANFSPEHGEEINTYFQHSEEEAEYFRLLLAHERAGTRKLKDVYNRKLEALLERRMEVKSRVRAARVLTEEDKSIYYSSSFYPLLHMACTLPRLQKLEALAAFLGAFPARVREGLEFLERTGLIDHGDRGWKLGSVGLHLEAGSKWIPVHHMHYRHLAIRNVDNARKVDLHYSGAVTVSLADARKIRESMLKNFEENMKVVVTSPEEEVFVYSFDFFRAGD